MTLKLGTKNLHYEISFHFEVLQPISKENTFEIDLVMCQSDLKPVSYKSKSSGKAIKLKKVSQIQPKIMLIQGCRIPGSGGAQAPPVFRTLSHKNAIKSKNLRF